MRTNLGVCLLAIALAAAADDESIGFKSVPLGATVEQYRQVFPDHQCLPGGNSCLFDRVEHCLKRVAGPVDGAACATRNTWAGQAVARIFAGFKDGRLERVSITFTPSSFDAVYAANKERWGAPDTDSTETIQSNMGAQFENRMVRWVRGDSILIVRKYAARVDQGSALIISKASMQESIEKVRAAPKTNAKDL